MEYRKVYSKRKELFSSSIHLPCRTLLSSQVMDLWTTVNVRMSESTLENDSFAKLWFKFYWFPITKKFIFCFTLHFILTPSKTNFSTIIHEVCLVLKCTGKLWYLDLGYVDNPEYVDNPGYFDECPWYVDVCHGPGRNASLVD